MLVLQTDASYLRAARAGNLDKLLDLLQSGKANISTTNAVSSCVIVILVITILCWLPAN